MGLHLLPSYIHRIHTGLESWTEETKKGTQLLWSFGFKAASQCRVRGGSHHVQL